MGKRANGFKQKPESRKMAWAGILLLLAGVAIVTVACLTGKQEKKTVQIANPLYSADAFVPTCPAKKAEPGRFVAEFTAHQGMPAEKGCIPLKIRRTNKDGWSGEGRGAMFTYGDDFRIVMTSAHVFAKDYGGEAQYQIVSIDGQPIGFIEELMTPKDMGIKIPFVPDLVICKPGERRTLPSIDAGQQVVHERVALIEPIKLTPLEAGLPEMTLIAVIDWSSPFPVLVAGEKSEPGLSGSVYFNDKGQCFILSASVNEKGGTLFVPSNPIQLPRPKEEQLFK